MYIEQEVLRLNSIITELCKKNPEICPHDYQWDYTDTPKDGKRKKWYKCCLCGKMDYEYIGEFEN